MVNQSRSRSMFISNERMWFTRIFYDSKQVIDIRATSRRNTRSHVLYACTGSIALLLIRSRCCWCKILCHALYGCNYLISSWKSWYAPSVYTSFQIPQAQIGNAFQTDKTLADVIETDRILAYHTNLLSLPLPAFHLVWVGWSFVSQPYTR